MNEKDLEFTYIKDNKEIICTIISLIPKNESESYIVFTEKEHQTEGDIILKYGILVDNSDSLELKRGVSEEEINYIKEQFHEELINFSKGILESELI